MIAEMLNIVGFHLPEDCGHRWRSDYTSDDQGVVHDPRLYSKEGCEEDSRQEDPFEAISQTERLLSCLSPHDVRSLIHAEDELSAAQVFTRIWPTRNTHTYHKFMEKVPYEEKLMDAWERKFVDETRDGRRSELRRATILGRHLNAGQGEEDEENVEEEQEPREGGWRVDKDSGKWTWQ